MYNCVAMEIKKTETAYVALSDGLCFVFFSGGVGFMGQTWEAHVGPCRRTVGCTRRECPRRWGRRGGVTTCCRSRQVYGKNTKRKGEYFNLADDSMELQLLLLSTGSLPWPLVSVVVAAKQELCNHILLSWALAIPGGKRSKEPLSTLLVHYFLQVRRVRMGTWGFFFLQVDWNVIKVDVIKLTAWFWNAGLV